MNKILLSTFAIIGTEARMSFGACPEMTYQENFDMNAFSGKWYELERDKIFTWEFGQECVTENFMPTSDDGAAQSFYFRG